jgi:hypothetical protein
MIQKSPKKKLPMKFQSSASDITFNIVRNQKLEKNVGNVFMGISKAVQESVYPTQILRFPNVHNISPPKVVQNVTKITSLGTTTASK